MDATTLMLTTLQVFMVLIYSDASRITPKDCSASSEYSTELTCDNVYDGISDATGDGIEWVTNQEGVGSWIQLNFDGNYVISRLRIQQRYYSGELSKGITLSFSDESSQDIELAYRSEDAYLWEDFTLTPVTSMFIRLTVTSVWTTTNNGFIEIQVYLPDECKRTKMGPEYQGMVSQTLSGVTCQHWTADSPHERNYQSQNADNFPDTTLDGASNFCRNPDSSSQGQWFSGF